MSQKTRYYVSQGVSFQSETFVQGECVLIEPPLPLCLVPFLIPAKHTIRQPDGHARTVRFKC
jgi:hypothetical protein